MSIKKLTLLPYIELNMRESPTKSSIDGNSTIDFSQASQINHLAEKNPTDLLIEPLLFLEATI
jgi:hypothetical protein